MANSADQLPWPTPLANSDVQLSLANPSAPRVRGNQPWKKIGKNPTPGTCTHPTHTRTLNEMGTPWPNEKLLSTLAKRKVSEHSSMFSRHVEHRAKRVGVVIAVKYLVIESLCVPMASFQNCRRPIWAESNLVDKGIFTTVYRILTSV